MFTCKLWTPVNERLDYTLLLRNRSIDNKTLGQSTSIPNINTVSVGLINARSIGNKSLILNDIIANRNLDLNLTSY